MACEKEAAAKDFGAGRRKVCGRTTRSTVPAGRFRAGEYKEKPGSWRACEDEDKGRAARGRFAPCIYDDLHFTCFLKFTLNFEVIRRDDLASRAFRLPFGPALGGLLDVRVEASFADRAPRARHKVLIIGEIDLR